MSLIYSFSSYPDLSWPRGCSNSYTVRSGYEIRGELSILKVKFMHRSLVLRSSTATSLNGTFVVTKVSAAFQTVFYCSWFKKKKKPSKRFVPPHSPFCIPWLSMAHPFFHWNKWFLDPIFWSFHPSFILWLVHHYPIQFQFGIFKCI